VNLFELAKPISFRNKDFFKKLIWQIAVKRNLHSCFTGKNQETDDKDFF